MHSNLNSSTVVIYNEKNMCALIDTGAQISLIGEETWKRVRKGDETLTRDESLKLVGIVGEAKQCLGIVELAIRFEDSEVMNHFPFAIVEQTDLPCCMLIGLNYLEHLGNNINFDKSQILMNNGNKVKLKTDLTIALGRDQVNLTNIEIAGESEREDELGLVEKGEDGIATRVTFRIDEEEIRKNAKI